MNKIIGTKHNLNKEELKSLKNSFKRGIKTRLKMEYDKNFPVKIINAVCLFNSDGSIQLVSIYKEMDNEKN